MAALPIDYNGNLVNSIGDTDARNGLWVLSVIDTRAQFLQAGQVVDQAALDPYSFIREGYLQRRRNQVYDGNPPEEDYTESP